MLHIKIIGSDGKTIIGAEAIPIPVYVKLEPVTKIEVRCSNVAAQGVVSLDDSQTYQLAGRPALPGDHLTADIISEADYDQIIQELDIDPAQDDDQSGDGGDEGGDDSGESDTMNAQQMREKILEQAERITFLEDCMLEMSETIYA